MALNRSQGPLVNMGVSGLCLLVLSFVRVTSKCSHKPAADSGLAGAFAYTLYSMPLKMSLHSALPDHCVVTKGRLSQQRTKWQIQSTDRVSHATDLCCTYEHQQLYLQTTLWHLRENYRGRASACYFESSLEEFDSSFPVSQSR